MNARTRQLKQHVHELELAGVRRSRFSGLVAESLRETAGEPAPLRRARAFAHLLEAVPQVVLPHELIAGSQLGLWPLADVPGFEDRLAEARQVVRAHLAGRDARAPRGGLARWALMSRDHYVANIRFQDFQRIAAIIAAELVEEDSIPYGEVAGVLERHFEWPEDPEVQGLLEALPWFAAHHLHLKYATALEQGLDGLRAGILARLSARLDMDKQVFYESCRIAIEACSGFIERYADTLKAAAAQAPDGRAAELRAMAATCAAVAHGVPQSFREAIQLVWMLHVIANIQGGAAMSLARFDQYLWPFYARDLAAQNLTREEARELIECLWFKVNEPHMRTVQSVTLGGLTPDGSDGTNDLTTLCIEIVGETGEPYPNPAVRVHAHCPDRLYEAVAAVMQLGGGQPMVFNDDVMLAGLARQGFPERDAREYYNTGCIEIMLAGLQPCLQGAGSVIFPAELELVFSDGQVNDAGDTGLPTGALEGFDTFEGFLEAFLTQVRHRVSGLCRAADVPIAAGQAGRCDPFASCLVDDCLTQGLDVCGGGARYSNWVIVNSQGLGTAVDALAAIREFVYERKTIALEEMKDMLAENFRGREATRQQLAQGAPKYGNDRPEVDAIATRVYDVFVNAVTGYSSACGMIFSPEMFSYHVHVCRGELTGASADGRPRGEPYSDGMGPSQGKDTRGPTSLLRSVTQLDHTWLTGGCACNLRLSPDHVRGADGRAVIEALLRGYLACGGLQLQVNIIDTETLRQAQEAPQDYRHIVVRVAGFCEYFVNLDRSLQNEIITRTAHQV